MKRLLTLLTVMLMLVTVFALSVTANAANTYLSATTVEGTTSYSRGDTVTAVFSTSFAEPIDVFAAEFDFDDDVFQVVKRGTKWLTVVDTDWYAPISSINVEDKLAAYAVTDPYGDLNADLTQDLSGDVLQLILTVKDTAAFGQHDITFRLRHINGSTDLCDETVTLTINIACTNHSYTEKVDAQYLVSEANCQSPAIYKKSCEHCGVASATETFENGTKLDHTYTNGWVTDGDDTHTRKCDNFAVCGYSETLGHNWDAGSVVSEPSCYKLGVKKYTCTDNCGATKEENYGELKDHTYGDWTPNNDGTHSRTCQVAECGHVDGPHNCSYNGIVQIVGDKEHHKEVCTVCKYDHLLDHNWGTGEETKAPSCAEGERTYTCVCNEKKTEAIPATGEHITKVSSVDAYKHVTTCDNDCGYSLEGDHVLTNCVDNGNGYHKGTCSVCGNTEALDEHNYDYTNVSVINEPNCTDPGLQRVICSDCGANNDTPIGTNDKHNYGAWTKLDGNKHTRICANNAEHTETANHNWNEGVEDEPASCYAPGKMLYTCTDGCGATKEEDIDPTNAHAWGAWADNGDNHVRYCTTVGCGEPNYADHDWSHNCDTLCDTCGHTRTVVHIYGHVATADEHWNACGICGDIEPGSRAPHNVVNGECADCGYKASRPMSGFFYVNDDYHMMVLTDGVITGHHILDVNGNCTICGAHISDVVEDEIVIEAPVESNTEETETEPVVNPTTGLAFALITVAAAAAVAVASKKH